MSHLEDQPDRPLWKRHTGNGPSLVVSLEHRFYQREDGVFTRLAFSHDYWKNYLTVFDEVTIMARLTQEEKATAVEEVRVTGDRVSFIAMPYYVGIGPFLKNLPAAFVQAWKTAANHDHFLLRSGNISHLLWICLILQGKPYLREYPGNIREGILGFVGEGARWPIRMIAAFSHHLAKLQGRQALACSYVSEAIRQTYPARSRDREYVFSTAVAVTEVAPREDQAIDGPFRIVTVGRLEREKGHEVLLRAVAGLVVAGHQLEIHLIGDGSQRSSLEYLASRLGVTATFHGTVLDKTLLFNIVRRSNLFVLPSLTEGMPRALLEAMSLRVPCLASHVGGVPEVLDDRYTLPPGDSGALGQAIAEMGSSNSLREENAETNYVVATIRQDVSANLARMEAFWKRAL